MAMKQIFQLLTIIKLCRKISAVKMNNQIRDNSHFLDSTGGGLLDQGEIWDNLSTWYPPFYSDLSSPTGPTDSMTGVGAGSYFWPPQISATTGAISKNQTPFHGLEYSEMNEYSSDFISAMNESQRI